MKRILSLLLILTVCLSIPQFACADKSSLKNFFGSENTDSEKEKNPTPFDKLVERPSVKEAISELGTPDLSGDTRDGYVIMYSDYAAYGWDENTLLRVDYDKLGSFVSAEWGVAKYGDFNKDLDLEKVVIEIRDSLTENYGDYTREEGVYIWYDIIGNSYSLTTGKGQVELFFNNPTAAKSFGK